MLTLMPVSISPTIFPLRPMSYSRLPTPARAEDASEARCAGTGLPATNVGLVVTLTERNWPGLGEKNSDEPSGDQTGWLPMPISYCVPVAGNGCTYVRVPVACALTVEATHCPSGEKVALVAKADRTSPNGIDVLTAALRIISDLGPRPPPGFTNESVTVS